jgi:myosin-crossreactive antigen
MAPAAFMTRDAAMADENIFIYQNLKTLGSSLDAANRSVTGSSMRSSRMFVFKKY